MLAKCANPECSHVFRYFGAGKLYRLSSRGTNRNREVGGTEHFWLCGDCAPTMTVAVEPDGKVIVIPVALIRTYREAVGRLSPLPEIAPALLELHPALASHV